MQTHTIESILRAASNVNDAPTFPVIRVMPNLPAAYRSASTALTAGKAALPHHIMHATNTLAAVGSVHNIPQRLFAPATAVAGCGVAYVFMMAEALADAGVKNGLTRDKAIAMAAETIKGAGDVLMSGEHPAVLRNRVESPGGVTVAATAALDHAGFRGCVADAVDKAVERVREMGES